MGRHLVGKSYQDRKVLAVDTGRRRRKPAGIFGKLWLPAVVLVVFAIVGYGVNTVRHASQAITNPPAMEPYRAAVGATIEQYGGRFLARAGATELIEGGPEPKRIVILEFADKAAFKRWYDSPEYQKILPGRLDNSTARAFVVEGVS